MFDSELSQQYIRILKEELVPAMGCTEPIAIAYAAAKAREVLDAIPERCSIEVSGNIIKNVKSVLVPNTGGLKGIEAALAAGVVAGDANAALEVLSNVTESDFEAIYTFLKSTPICVIPSKPDSIFYIKVKLLCKDESSEVVLENYHTNITRIERNGNCIFSADSSCENEYDDLADRSTLNVKDILEFARSVDLVEVEDVLSRQIEFNTAIAQEGLNNEWGAAIGKTLMDMGDMAVSVRARAAAAAGSDARMSGCSLPVIIVSGSGNQGLTASLPVIEYAKEWGSDKDTLYRALIVSNLITIHQKTGIGRLSAYCGAVSAGCGAGAGIAYLKHGADYEIIAHTIVNAVAILSGMMCDGAKPSCAAKIASSVDAGILGYMMYANGHQFLGGEGIIAKGVENTIKNVGRLAQEGMRSTDREILKIMVGDA